MWRTQRQFSLLLHAPPSLHFPTTAKITDHGLKENIIPHNTQSRWNQINKRTKEDVGMRETEGGDPLMNTSFITTESHPTGRICQPLTSSDKPPWEDSRHLIWTEEPHTFGLHSTCSRSGQRACSSYDSLFAMWCKWKGKCATVLSTLCLLISRAVVWGK